MLAQESPTTQAPAKPGNAVGQILGIAGAGLQAAAVIAMVVYVLGMAQSFSMLGANGISDPHALSAGIGAALMGVASAVVSSLLGCILMTIALTACKYRAPWFFWFCVCFSVPLLLAFPVGTAFGAFFLIYCLMHKEEFLAPITR